MISVKQIVRQYLIDNGYDGLTSTVIECGCLVDDLIPCESGCDMCVAGHKVDGCSDDCGLGCDWHIVAAHED